MKSEMPLTRIYRLKISVLVSVAMFSGNAYSQESVDDILSEFSPIEFHQDQDAIQSEMTPNQVLLESRKHSNELVYNLNRNKQILQYLLLASMFVSSVFIVRYLLCTLRKTNNYSPFDIVVVTGLVLIIVAIITIVVIADTNEQLNVSIGVLGTIGGYLFGTLKSK